MCTSSILRNASGAHLKETQTLLWDSPLGTLVGSRGDDLPITPSHFRQRMA